MHVPRFKYVELARVPNIMLCRFVECPFTQEGILALSRSESSQTYGLDGLLKKPGIQLLAEFKK